jgi:protein-tyrosine-phosphatase
MSDSAENSKAVLVLGRDIRAFLTTIRSLGRAGLTVHVGMCPADDLPLRSRYVSHYHDIPNYTENSDLWLKGMLALIDQYHFELVIPTNDESVIPIQFHRQVLLDKCPVYALDDRVFELAMDKIASSVLAEELGIPVPMQVQISFENPNPALPEGFSYPVVIKPPSSFTEEDLENRREVHHIRSEKEFQEFVTAHADWKQALLQNNFAGIGTGIEVLADQGEILFAFQHYRVHEPISGGASSYRKSVPLDPGLLAATERFLGALNYSGVAMVEYKLNPDTGKWVFIEINARFWGSLPLAVSAGADFPLYLYQYLRENRRDFPQIYKSNVYSRNFLRDLYWMSDNIKARLRKKNISTTVPLNKVAGEFINMVTLKERIDSFSFDDPAPALGELKGILALIFNKLFNFFKGAALTAAPVRRHIAGRIKTEFKNANSVLFVCYGNICRSPFAEQYLIKQMGNSYRMGSSGFHQVDNRQSPRAAITAARKLNIDLSGHRSNTISDYDVDQADLIFVFDEKNLLAFSEHFPASRSRVHLLGYLLDSGPLEIIDPFGGSDAEFECVYSVIQTAINNLTKE